MSGPDQRGDLRRDVAALVEAGRIAEAAGDGALARSHFERAMRSLSRDESEHVPALIRRIARSYLDDGIHDAALDCLAAAQHLSRARGDTIGVAHALCQMAEANLRRGDAASAEALCRKAQSMAGTTGDAGLMTAIEETLRLIYQHAVRSEDARLPGPGERRNATTDA